MYRLPTLIAYIFAALSFFPISSQLLGMNGLFFDNTFLVYYQYRWYLFGFALFFGLIGWFSARKQIDLIVTTTDNFIQGQFSKKQKELKKLGKMGEKKLKHLAMRVSWSPILNPSMKVKGWQAMDTTYHKKHELKVNKVDDVLVNITPKFTSKLFSFYTLMLGLVVLSITFFSAKFDWVMFLTSLVFIILGIWLIRTNKTEYYFNKANNSYGFKEYGLLSHKSLKDEHILSINSIAALQIIYLERGSEESNLWELNLITQDAKRYNIMQNTYRVELAKNAQKLSKFLEVPVWEDTGIHYELVQENTMVFPTWDTIMDKVLGK